MNNPLHAGFFSSVLEQQVSAFKGSYANAPAERVLQGRTDQRLDDFLKIVQASDLSALSNTLSDELVALLRQILQ